jgi:beta-lactamase class A
MLMTALAAPMPAAAAPDPLPAAAPDERTALESRADEVVALLNGGVQPEAIFTQGFRAAIADAQMKALSASLTAQFGRALEVAVLLPRDGTRAALEIRFEHGLAKGGIAISPDEDNRISELRFTSVDAAAVPGDTAQSIAADLAALPGTVNAWFGPLGGGAPVIARNAETPLALGSTFKLYVLAALAEDVKAGRRQWSDVVPLTEKSYPSGQLHDWPRGAPITLHTLAGLMIGISDNTATDQLIKVLGRDRILRLMGDSGHRQPAANDPLLTTRELFLLKASPDELIELWRRGGTVARTAIATMAAQTWRPLADVNAAFGKGPRAIDIEWFAAPSDLARLFAHMRRTADPAAFEIMAINPSASDSIRANWRYIGFKGGSEPGVLNLTWLLTDEAGRDWVLSLGWNNPEAVVDEGELRAIAHRILLLPR